MASLEDKRMAWAFAQRVVEGFRHRRRIALRVARIQRELAHLADDLQALAITPERLAQESQSAAEELPDPAFLTWVQGELVAPFDYPEDADERSVGHAALVEYGLSDGEATALLDNPLPENSEAMEKLQQLKDQLAFTKSSTTHMERALAGADKRDSSEDQFQELEWLRHRSTALTQRIAYIEALLR